MGGQNKKEALAFADQSVRKLQDEEKAKQTQFATELDEMKKRAELQVQDAQRTAKDDVDKAYNFQRQAEEKMKSDLDKQRADWEKTSFEANKIASDKAYQAQKEFEEQKKFLGDRIQDLEIKARKAKKDAEDDAYKRIDDLRERELLEKKKSREAADKKAAADKEEKRAKQFADRNLASDVFKVRTPSQTVVVANEVANQQLAD